MGLFFVVQDQHGSTFAADTLTGAIDAANLDLDDRVEDAWRVVAPDAGAARLMTTGRNPLTPDDVFAYGRVLLHVRDLDALGAEGTACPGQGGGTCRAYVGVREGGNEGWIAELVHGSFCVARAKAWSEDDAWRLGRELLRRYIKLVARRFGS